MAGLRGHFDSDTAAPPPPYSAQPSTYDTSSAAYNVAHNVVPAQQHGYNYPPSQSPYNNPGLQAQPPPPTYPQPGGRSPYLQPQSGTPYSPGLDAKHSPHLSTQPGGKSPRLQPQKSPSLAPQWSSPHSPGASNSVAIQPRTLHIYNTSSSQGTIADSDKKTSLYSYRTHSWTKPNLELHSTASNTVIGSITFHSFSSTIDLTLHNQPLPLQSNGWLASGHKFVSRAGVPGMQQGGELRWKDQGLSAGQVLLDQRDQVLARWENSSWALSKEGKLLLQGPCAVAGPLMDEVVLTRLAEMMYRKRRNNAAAAGGGGA